jgi:hypothetical protein
VTQASLAPTLEPKAPAHRPAAPVPETDRPSGAVPLWLLGLTAVLLVYVSVQSLALIVRNGPSDSLVHVAATVPAMAAAVVALAALAYVYAISVRSGSLAPDDGDAGEQASSTVDGLVIAPSVPARVALPHRASALPRSASRSPQVRPRSQARAIAAAAAANTDARPVSARPVPSPSGPTRTTPARTTPARTGRPNPPPVRPPRMPRRSGPSGPTTAARVTPASRTQASRAVPPRPVMPRGWMPPASPRADTPALQLRVAGRQVAPPDRPAPPGAGRPQPTAMRGPVQVVRPQVAR